MGLLSKALDKLQVVPVPWLIKEHSCLPFKESRLKARSHHGQEHKSAQPHLPMSVAQKNRLVSSVLAVIKIWILNI